MAMRIIVIRPSNPLPLRIDMDLRFFLRVILELRG